jgi:hypothetical protein
MNLHLFEWARLFGLGPNELVTRLNLGGAFVELGEVKPTPGRPLKLNYKRYRVWQLELRVFILRKVLGLPCSDIREEFHQGARERKLEVRLYKLLENLHEVCKTYAACNNSEDLECLNGGLCNKVFNSKFHELQIDHEHRNLQRKLYSIPSECDWDYYLRRLKPGHYTSEKLAFCTFHIEHLINQKFVLGED